MKPVKQAVRYGVVGTLNTVVSLTVIYLFMALGVGDVTANAVGYLLGLSLSYVLNSQWTFGYRGAHAGAVPRFLLVLAAAYAANLAALLLARDWGGVDSHLAQLFGVAAYVGIGFVGSWLYVFSR